jgi:ferric-dicitrate binding protein FerR (iron transport regulator)
MIDKNIINSVLTKKASAQQAKEVALYFSTEDGQDYLSKEFDTASFSLKEAEVENMRIPSFRMKMRFIQYLQLHHKRVRTRWMVAAAIIPFLIMVGVAAFFADRAGVFSGNEYVQIDIPVSEQARIILADGTAVHLNSASTLRYKKSFGIFSREVFLNGEGYFEVTKNKAKNFVVHCGNIKIKVTGTKFNVKAYREDEKITVSLDEGSVNIIDKNSNVYLLPVNHTAFYDRKVDRMTINDSQKTGTYTAWREKGINFYRTPLCDVLKTLERQYGVGFEMKNPLALSYKFSISTENVPINEILADLEKVSDVRFSIIKKDTFSVVTKR